MGVSKNRLETESAGQTFRSGKLPTMYDLPSEDPRESGLPDEFHDL